MLPIEGSSLEYQRTTETMMFRVDDIRATHHTGGNVPIRELEECVWVLRKAIEKVCGWGWWGHTLLWLPIVTFKG